ncbi:MAG TPA: hypothetical protein VM076_04605 [Gemmatimonadaceae bacterium]|nr:hypothetical protein [Gemmatimonadaceae bacterium]
MTTVSTAPAVLFVCLHGAAKSLIAARECERRAAARGFVVTCSSAGLEPDPTVPPPVVSALASEGIDVSGYVPAAPTDEMVAAATHIVTFGCDLAAPPSGGQLVQRWTGVPDVSDGYDAARAVIIDRVDRLLDEITETSSQLNHMEKHP